MLQQSLASIPFLAPWIPRCAKTQKILVARRPNSADLFRIRPEKGRSARQRALLFFGSWQPGPISQTRIGLLYFIHEWLSGNCCGFGKILFGVFIRSCNKVGGGRSLEGKLFCGSGVFFGRFGKELDAKESEGGILFMSKPLKTGGLFGCTKNPTSLKRLNFLIPSFLSTSKKIGWNLLFWDEFPYTLIIDNSSTWFPSRFLRKFCEPSWCGQGCFLELLVEKGGKFAWNRITKQSVPWIP